MTGIEMLEEALASLQQRVMDFPIGAIALDDLKPTETKIGELRQRLKAMNARLLILKAKSNINLISEESEEDVGPILDKLHEEMANVHINDAAINLALHSNTIHQILFDRTESIEVQEKLKGHMRRLFTLNDAVIKLQQSMKDAIERELEMKIECRNELFDYRTFIQEQRELRDKKLQESNPKIARNKQKVDAKLAKINIMKRLMTNMIAAAGHMYTDEPSLPEMLKKHRSLITIENILVISQRAHEGESSSS